MRRACARSPIIMSENVIDDGQTFIRALYDSSIAVVEQLYSQRASAPQDTTTNPKLEELKKPWPALKLTPAPKQSRTDVATAKALWDPTLEFRNSQQKHTRTKNAGKSKLPIFPFLDLPPELRNRIYDIYASRCHRAIETTHRLRRAGRRERWRFECKEIFAGQ
jgi:hypothetical protein